MLFSRAVSKLTISSLKLCDKGNREKHLHGGINSQLLTVNFTYISTSRQSVTRNLMKWLESNDHAGTNQSKYIPCDHKAKSFQNSLTT